MERRHFIRIAGAGIAALGTGSFNRILTAAQSQKTDAEICASIFAFAREQNLAGKPMGEIIASIGTRFLNTPYVAHTLELLGEERLVVNLREFDCTTFTESVLAFARCVKKGTTTFDAFRSELQLIRYRGGVIEGYPSRLHYFSDWILDNTGKGLVRDITGSLKGSPFNKKIGYMSAFPEKYRQLKESPELLSSIRKRENVLSATTFLQIPKKAVSKLGRRIPHGAIIAITSDIELLDINHVGFAYHRNGAVHFLHAPIALAAVEVTGDTLAEYLQRIPRHAGIMVLTAVEPSV